MNLYNSEGYLDPTAHDAIVNVLKEQRKRRICPRCSSHRPLPGIQRNIKNARRYCAFAVRSGYIPFAPHLFYPQFLSDGDTDQRELGLFMGMVFLDSCKEVWVFGARIIVWHAAGD